VPALVPCIAFAPVLIPSRSPLQSHTDRAEEDQEKPPEGPTASYATLDWQLGAVRTAGVDGPKLQDSARGMLVWMFFLGLQLVSPQWDASKAAAATISVYFVPALELGGDDRRSLVV